MQAIRPDITAKKWQRHEYGGFIVQPHPNAAGGKLFGVRRPDARKFCAGPFRTEAEAHKWIDAAPRGED